MSLAAKPQDLGTVGGYLWEVRPDALKFGADLLLYHGRPDEAWAMALFLGLGWPIVWGVDLCINLCWLALRSPERAAPLLGHPVEPDSS